MTDMCICFQWRHVRHNANYIAKLLLFLQFFHFGSYPSLSLHIHLSILISFTSSPAWFWLICCRHSYQEQVLGQVSRDPTSRHRQRETPKVGHSFVSTCRHRQRETPKVGHSFVSTCRHRQRETPKVGHSFVSTCRHRQRETPKVGHSFISTCRHRQC